MANVKFDVDNGSMTIHLIGRLDTMTAPAAEKEIQAAREKNAPNRILVDCSKLDFISSAGLRVILRLKKAVRDTKIINVSFIVVI